MTTVENQNVEWKESWHDEYLKWIAGFANADGGVLTIGRNDRGDVVGVSKAAKLMEDIPNKVRDILGIRVKITPHSEKGLDYLVISVDPHPFPVSYKGQYFIRSGSTKHELKGAALDHFLLRKQGKRWDGVPVPDVSISDLDGQTLATFRKRATKSKRLSSDILDENDAELIRKLHLTEGTYLKRAALLLFHPDPEEFFTGAFIKIGFFLSNSDLRYHDEIHGDLFSQIDRTMDLLLTKYLNAAISYEGLQRVETYPVPEEALREALLNSVAHKDYASGVPIQISVHPERIFFWNSAELKHGWTVDTLISKHESQPFNPDVANTFFLSGMIESWGRGIERILTLCRNADIPSPELRYQSSGLWLTFPLRAEAVNKVTGEVGGEVTGEVVKLLLAVQGEMKRLEIQAALGLKSEDSFRKLYLKPALKTNLIEMTIPDKPNSRLQKYRLTGKGHNVIAQFKKTNT
jgi:ATP-dependent DNA helicase RecG